MKTSAKTFKMRLKKDDIVVVRSGKYKGQSGKILAVHPKLNKVTVEGINIVKKHVKPTRENPQGAIVERTLPMWAAKVGIAHPTEKGKASKIGYNINKDGKKTRVYKNADNKEIK